MHSHLNSGPCGVKTSVFRREDHTKDSAFLLSTESKGEMAFCLTSDHDAILDSLFRFAQGIEVRDLGDEYDSVKLKFWPTPKRLLIADLHGRVNDLESALNDLVIRRYVERTADTQFHTFSYTRQDDKNVSFSWCDERYGELDLETRIGEKRLWESDGPETDGYTILPLGYKRLAARDFKQSLSSQPASFSPSELSGLLNMSSGTLNKHAKRAEVKTPGCGNRNHRYSLPDAIKIARRVIQGNSGTAQTVACKRFIADHPATS